MAERGGTYGVVVSRRSLIRIQREQTPIAMPRCAACGKRCIRFTKTGFCSAGCAIHVAWLRANGREPDGTYEAAVLKRRQL